MKMMYFARRDRRIGWKKRKGNNSGSGRATTDKKNKNNTSATGNKNNNSIPTTGDRDCQHDNQEEVAIFIPNRRRKEVKGPKLSTLVESTNFDSVLTKPFDKWNDIEMVISNIIPEWTHQQRGCIILHLIRFLELKVLMDDYDVGKNNHLLTPSPLIQIAWRALILETQLYKRVTCTIQDFHGRTRRMIHHTSSSVISTTKTTRHNEDDERFRRTQSLFQCCYGEAMPVSLNEVDSCDISLTDASALTDLGPYYASNNTKTNNDGGFSGGFNNRIKIIPSPAGTPNFRTRANSSSSGIVVDIQPSTKISSQPSKTTPTTPSSSSSIPDIVERQRKNFVQKLKEASPFVCFSMVHDSMFGGNNNGTINLDDHITEITPDTSDNDDDGMANMMEGVEVIDVP